MMKLLFALALIAYIACKCCHDFYQLLVSNNLPTSVNVLIEALLERYNHPINQ